jgi:hypothetical protein
MECPREEYTITNSSVINEKVMRYGNVIVCYFRWYGVIADSGTKIGTLPSSIAPSTDRNCILPAVSANDNGFRGHATIAIKSDGDIYVYKQSDWSNVGNSLISVTETWII